MGSILLVEDDASVRAILSLMLVRMGHEVIGTATLRASVEVVLGQKPLDLAVLDVILPDGSGCQVAKVAEISRPTLPIMLIAALDGASLLHCGYLDARLLTANRNVRFLQKPFQFEEFRSRIEQLLRPEIDPSVAPQRAVLKASLLRS